MIALKIFLFSWLLGAILCSVLHNVIVRQMQLNKDEEFYNFNQLIYVASAIPLLNNYILLLLIIDLIKERYIIWKADRILDKVRKNIKRKDNANNSTSTSYHD